MHFSCSNDKIIGRLLLKHQPHALNIVFCMTPITLRIKIAQLHKLLLTKTDLGNWPDIQEREKLSACTYIMKTFLSVSISPYFFYLPCDFSGYKSLSSSWGLMVEQNSIASKHSICLAEVDYRPVCKKLSHTIGRPRVEWGGFLLGDLLDFSVQLRRRSLVELDRLLQTTCFDSIQKSGEIQFKLNLPLI